jgi:hypothetical protein
MSMTENDGNDEEGELRHDPALSRLADLLCIEISTFFHSSVQPGVTSDKVVRLSHMSDLQLAVSRIEDEKTREYMARLIQTLEEMKASRWQTARPLSG